MSDTTKTLADLKAERTRIATELHGLVKSGETLSDEDYERAEQLNTDLETTITQISEAEAASEEPAESETVEDSETKPDETAKADRAAALAAAAEAALASDTESVAEAEPAAEDLTSATDTKPVASEPEVVEPDGEPTPEVTDAPSGEADSTETDTAADTGAEVDTTESADAADTAPVAASAAPIPNKSDTSTEATMPDTKVDPSGALDAIVASGTSSDIPAATQEPEKALEPNYTITASASTLGFDPGEIMNGVEDMSTALLAAVEHFPDFQPGSGRGMDLRKQNIAKINLQFEDALVASGDNPGELLKVLEFAGDETRLEQPLTAAGWCAPSDNVLELCPPASLEGMIDTPEFAVTGGGVNYASGPDFSSLFDAGFLQTEAQAIARTPKDCVTIPCPTFEEERLDAIGLCVKGGLLMRAAYPQWVEGYTSRVIAAHRHKVNQYKINKISAGSTDLVLNTGAFGTSIGDTLERVELVLEGEREKFRLGLTQSIEVAFPHWVRAVFRADLSKRVGASPDRPITDADLDAHFRSINARVQWLHDWTGVGGQSILPGAHAAANPAYPATFRALIYVAGTWKTATKPVINLSAVYDAASLEVNEYTGLFVEQGILVLKSGCYDSFELQIPVCNAGRTGASDISCA